MNNISLSSCDYKWFLLQTFVNSSDATSQLYLLLFQTGYTARYLHFEPCQYDKRLGSMSQRIENEELLNYQYFLYN